jgi:hypothetical protein
MDDFNMDNTVAEDEAMTALRSLNIGNMSNVDTLPLSTQEMARRCFLSKKYQKKHHFAYSIKQKLSIVQEAIEVKNFRSTATKYKVQPCQI